MKLRLSNMLFITALATLFGACSAKNSGTGSALQTFTTTGELKSLSLEDLLSTFPSIAQRLKNPQSAEDDGSNVIGIAMGGGSSPAYLADKPSFTNGVVPDGVYSRTWGTGYMNCSTLPCRQEGSTTTGWGFAPPGSIDPKIQNGAIYYMASQMLGITGSAAGKKDKYTHELSIGTYDSVKSDLAGKTQSQDKVVVIHTKSTLRASGESSQKTIYIANNGQLIGVQTIDSIVRNGQMIKDGPSSEIQFVRK